MGPGSEPGNPVANGGFIYFREPHEREDIVLGCYVAYGSQE